jgi:uncharacterized protein YidB (DUF937 family)
MGLLDILNSIGAGAGDPRTRPAPAGPATGQAGSQGMSPMAKAMLALLAMYAMKHMQRADAPTPRTAPQPAPRPGGAGAGAGPGNGGPGNLGDLLRGTLGGVLGGAAAGTVLNGGLGGLLKQFQENGQGDVAHSWVGTGPNKTISEGDLASALGGDTLDTLSEQTGMGRDDLLEGLRQYLPRFVDQLTPDGRVPNEDEAQRLI